ncbi:MAG: (2Fe-2S)-binding protein [Acidimicrobiia bacterium]|nr:(2Fe-2S)-binding protein [Acidimicrobiia bacterium]
MREITLQVNGDEVTRSVSPRRLLVDFLRHDLGLTGTHVGCEHGVCGACTVLLNGETVRSCIMFAVQADGQRVETVESLASDPEQLHPIQEAFWNNHGLQCGFCTPAMLLATKELLEENPTPDERQIRNALAGNICRCTGYVHIVQSVKAAAEAMDSEGGAT